MMDRSDLCWQSELDKSIIDRIVRYQAQIKWVSLQVSLTLPSESGRQFSILDENEI